MVRYLGLTCLWVDCLCVVRDNLADWEDEATQMTNVYSNAFPTVAAVRASHCDEWFLELRKPTLPVEFSDPERTFALNLPTMTMLYHLEHYQVPRS